MLMSDLCVCGRYIEKGYQFVGAPFINLNAMTPEGQQLLTHNLAVPSEQSNSRPQDLFSC